MKYTKPEIVTLMSATNAIQGGLKGLSAVIETTEPFEHTIGAYEADE